MSQMIFVNLPVTDLAAVARLLEALGAVNEPKFTDETAACMMLLARASIVMLLTHDKFSQFTPRPIADAQAGSRGAAVPVGRQPRKRRFDRRTRPWRPAALLIRRRNRIMAVMYGRSFADPDGHIWEIMWMDAAAAEQGATAIGHRMPQEA